MYRTIAIIGLGSLGGFLAKSISELENIKKIVLIDFDIVEQSNIKNSIYRKKDIGKNKTDSLKNIILSFNDSIELDLINEEYIEGKTKIPDCDLVLDCRDFICTRYNEIDAKLYLSSRYLIIDCRKDAKYQSNYKGKYIDNLTKTDIRNAAFNASLFINNGLIKELLEKQIVHRIELDYMEKVTNEIINNIIDKPDIVFDKNGGEKLLNLPESIQKIMDMNKKGDITICLGDKNSPLLSKIIPKSYFRGIDDIISNLTSFVNLPYSFNHYLISPVIENKSNFVILIPETGAA